MSGSIGFSIDVCWSLDVQQMFDTISTQVVLMLDALIGGVTNIVSNMSKITTEPLPLTHHQNDLGYRHPRVRSHAEHKQLSSKATWP